MEDEQIIRMQQERMYKNDKAAETIEVIRGLLDADNWYIGGAENIRFLLAHIDALQAQLTVTEDALGFYADCRHHRYVEHGEIWNDRGAKARSALAELKRQ